MIRHLFTLLCFSTLELLPKVVLFISSPVFLLCWISLCSKNIFSKLCFHFLVLSCHLLYIFLLLRLLFPSFPSFLSFPNSHLLFFFTYIHLLPYSSSSTFTIITDFTSFATSSPSLPSPYYRALSLKQMKTLGVLSHPGFLLALYQTLGRKAAIYHGCRAQTMWPESIEAVINLKHTGGHVSVCAGKGQETFSIMFIVTGVHTAYRAWLKSRAN